MNYQVLLFPPHQRKYSYQKNGDVHANSLFKQYKVRGATKKIKIEKPNCIKKAKKNKKGLIYSKENPHIKHHIINSYTFSNGIGKESKVELHHKNSLSTILQKLHIIRTNLIFKIKLHKRLNNIAVILMYFFMLEVSIILIR